MTETSVKKVNSTSAPRGVDGQRYLASGRRVAMRLWEAEVPGQGGEERARDYETVGYVVEGRARLRLAGQSLDLGPGDCWVVPAAAPHAYDILEKFTALEATAPPAHVHGRDAPAGG